MKQLSNKLLGLLLAFIMLAGAAALPASADGTMIVGEVTITSNTPVNLRSGGSTDYSIIGRGNSGELFQTTGQVPGGWYEILLPDERFAYISDKLVYFRAYPSPIPLGAQFTVPVYYMNRDGQTLKTVNVRVSPGQNVITADDNQVPGYRLTSTRSIYVFVDSTGKAVPSGVIFTYEQAYVQPTPVPTQPPVTQVLLPVYYKDIYNQVVASETRVLTAGSQLVKADPNRLPQGYYISGASDIVVSVSAAGVAAPSEVSFIVSRLVQTTPQPTQFYVPVRYQDEAGNLLQNTHALVSPGYTTVSADDSIVAAGMELTSARSIVVYTSNQGVTFPSTVIFTYRAGVKANVQIIYRDIGGSILYNETRQYAQGTHTITADDSRAPGRTLQGSRSAQVTVYANGTVSQNQVVFTYALPVSAQLTIEYRDNLGQTIKTVQRQLGAGTTTITADDSQVPSGYVLQSARNVQVTVYQNGTLSQDRVVYLYARPVSASIRIVYRESGGGELFSESRSFPQGNHTITANDGKVPSGYTLQSSRSVQVNVSAAGAATPSEVVFTYAPPAPPVTVNVPVVYKDQDGAVLNTTTVSVSSAAPKKVSADKNMAPANYVLSGSSSVTVTVSSSGVASPSQVVFVFRDPATITEPLILPAHINHSYSGKSIPVYSGPGTDYARAANGKASLGGGRIRIWGSDGDWVMIGYGLSNNLYRVGYIQRSQLPASLDIQPLHFGSQTATVVSEASLTDDPIVNPTWLMKIPVGTKVTLLAFENFVNPPHWAYIETTFNGQPIRGFVNKIRVKLD